jgi:ABC-type transport system involved in cytochrome bd biosynthesis fused ATPase/permease subunit
MNRESWKNKSIEEKREYTRKYKNMVLDFTILIVVWAIFLKVFNLFSSIVAFIITMVIIVCYLIFLL